MRTDFLSQRDPADENDYWYKKLGHNSFWAPVIEQGIIIIGEKKEKKVK